MLRLLQPFHHFFLVILILIVLSSTYCHALRLSNEGLPKIKAEVPKLQYDRSAVTPGILHVGIGNFYKAHLAAYMHDLMQKGDQTFDQSKAWGIVGGGVSKGHLVRQQELAEQDCLFTVVERSADVNQPTVVGSMINVLEYDGPNILGDHHHKPIQKMLLDPNIKIVSMTVTEGGYYLAGEENNLDVQHPAIVQDAENPDKPSTLFGLLVKALRKRRARGIKPFSVMSCDNIVHNGDVTKDVVVGLARMIEENLPESERDGLPDWIDQNVAFPNSMVDRITPATTVEEKQSGTEQNFGFQDPAVVYCEPWRQWIMEDTFCNGRPPFDELDNVDFVQDVTPFELMKIRILNGGHAALCYPARLLELDYVHEALEHPVIGPFLDKLERTEIVPCVGEVPGTDTRLYWKQTEERFRNPTVMDSIERNCQDGSARQPKFIVPTAIDCDHTVPKGLAMVSAMWCRYCAGTTEKSGIAIPEDADIQWERLHDLALKAKNDPKQWVTNLEDIYADLSHDQAFIDAFTEALNKIYADGVEAAMQSYIDEPTVVFWGTKTPPW